VCVLPPPPPPPSRTNWTRLVPPSVLTGHVSALHKRSSARVANAHHAWVQVFLAGSKFTTGVVLDVDGGHQVRARVECAVSAHQHSRALVELLPGVILCSGHVRAHATRIRCGSTR
jgi:hypothetical protein